MKKTAKKKAGIGEAVEQARGLLVLLDDRLPLIELSDNVLRLGAILEVSSPRARQDVFELGAAVSEVAGVLAMARIKADDHLERDLRAAIKLICGGAISSWAPASVRRLAERFKARVRKSSPEFGISDRRVLVIDDDPVAQEAICTALRKAGFITSSALSGALALRRLRVQRPSLIILDVEMPDIRGPRLLRMIRNEPRLVAVPVIFVSARKQLDVKLDALRSGADDYLTKPFRPEELATRVAARLERGAMLQEIALRDPLTGVASHRLFQEKLDEELARHARYKSHFSIACLDIDDLARVNEKEGYDAGDRLVRRVGQALSRSLRRADLIARLNGGEFGVIMPQTPISGAVTILERIRAKLARKSGGEGAVGISGGIAGCPETTADRRLLMAKAREALELAKRRGKGRLVPAGHGAKDVVIAEPQAPPDASGVLEGMSTSEIRTLREVFVRDLSEHLKRLDELDRSMPLRDRARAVGRMGHFLAGAGAIGGQPELGLLGEAMELSIERLLAAGVPPAGTELALAEMQDSLQRMGAGIRADSYHPSEAVSLEQRLRVNLGHPRFENNAQPGERADVLVVDDEKISQAAIGASLRRAGFSLREAYSGAEALEAVSARVPDVIILDVLLPDMDGHEVLARIRASPKLQLVPVIFVTAKRQLDDKIQALRTGADDYLTKPFSPEELVARVGSRLERAQITRDMALRDGLTGLYNHRFFQERLDHEVTLAARYHKPFCLALLDVDDFKAINDEHGHQAGDAVLRGLSSRLVDSLRSTDIVARYGGEEFAVILPETTLPAALEALDKVRIRVADELRVKAPRSGDMIRTTFSGGLAEARGEPKESVFARVDAALYQSKRTGKNRITLADAEEPKN